MGSYIYGVEKLRKEWCVWRFKATAADDAVAWLQTGEREGWVRWLCCKDTARAMAGENAMEYENLVIWED